MQSLQQKLRVIWEIECCELAAVMARTDLFNGGLAPLAIIEDTGTVPNDLPCCGITRVTC